MSNKKNLLIYAHYYIPDTASTGQILRELAEGMLDKFNIKVICVVPSYLGTIEDKYKTQKYYEEEINGVKVLRIRVPEFSKTNKKSRVKNIVSYFFGAMGATFKVGKMDYVFSISQPPILGGLLGVWGKWVKHAKYIEKLDIFADVKTGDFEAGVADGSIQYIPDEVYTAFVEQVKNQSVLFGETVNKDVRRKAFCPDRQQHPGLP